MRLFLTGDAVACAKHGQKVPHGHYNVEIMLHPITRSKAPVGVCASCIDARGITDTQLVGGRHRSSRDELADWTLSAEKIEDIGLLSSSAFKIRRSLAEPRFSSVRSGVP